MTTPEQPTQKTKGPYFDGQKVEPCGHYYPEVMRLRDERRGTDESPAYVRIVNCSYCGNYEIQLPENFIPRPNPQEIDEKDAPRVRQSELDRLLGKQKPQNGKK